MTDYAYRRSLSLLSSHSNARTQTARAVADEWRAGMSRAGGVHVVDFGTGDGDLLAAALVDAGAPRHAAIDLVERDRQLAETARTRLEALGYSATVATEGQTASDGSVRHIPRGTVTHFLAANVVHYLPARLAWVASVIPLLSPDGVLTIVMRSASCETRMLADIVRKAEGTPRAPSDGAITEVLRSQGYVVSRRTVTSRFEIPVEDGWSFDAATTEPANDLDRFVRWMLSVPVGTAVPTASVHEIADFLSKRLADGRLALQMESIVLAARSRH
jgi:protein-L-isoaspartate O-methyltransferase